MVPNKKTDWDGIRAWCNPDRCQWNNGHWLIGAVLLIKYDCSALKEKIPPQIQQNCLQLFEKDHDWINCEKFFPDFNMVINATSLGLKANDEIKLNYEEIGINKLFYDVIYNPRETLFLAKAKKYGNQIENGKMMFIYQAHQAFALWNKVLPNIDNETIKLLD